MLDMRAVATQPDEADAIDARISATVEALRVYKRVTKETVYQAMHVSRTAYYDRLSGVTRWSAADVQRAADALDVSVATLYLGLPHLDSNQKPADYQTAPVLTQAQLALAC